jgi:saccharopine dehydrogenase-like NADP-dependent oxidoreductase
MKALVLGCGEMGQVAIDDLVAHDVFAQVAVATRRLEAAETFLAGLPARSSRTAAFQVDVQDHAALVRLMKGYDVVCNTAGPNYLNAVAIAKAAIGAGVSLVDVSDDWEATLELFALHDAARHAGITVVVGLGASPGVTNVLARHGANQLDRTDEIRTSWVMRGSDPGGPALSHHLLFSLPHRAFVFQDGAMREVRPFVDGRETLRFPELGDVDVYHIGHPEPFMLARSFPGLRYADDKATFLPVAVNDMIVELGQVSRYAGAVRLNGLSVSPMDFAAACLHQTCKAMTDVPKTGALRTEVRGERGGRQVRLIYSAAGRIGIGTGVPASIGAHLLALGKITQRGVYPPEACIDPEWFLQAVTMRDIGDVVEEVIEE